MIGGERPSVRRLGLLIGLCVLAAAGVSIARAVSAGTIDLISLESDFTAHFLLALVLGVPLALAAFLHLRAYRIGATLELDAEALRTAISIQLLAAAAMPLTSSDVFCNLSYGQLTWIGLNPHAFAPIALGASDPFVLHQSGWRTTPSPYGPLMTALAFFAGLSGEVFGALLIFKLEILALSIAVVALAYAFCQRCLEPERRGPAFVALAFSPLFAWELSGQAHNDALLVLLLLGFVWAVVTEQEWPAFFAITAACVAKYVALPALAIYLAFVWRRSPKRAALMALVVGAAMVFALHPYTDGPLLPESIRQPSSEGHHARSLTDLACWLARPLGPLVERIAYAGGLTVAAAVMVFLTIRGMARATSASAVIQGALIATMALCLVTPWGQAWYATWLLPFAIAERDPRLQRLVVVYGALSLAQYGLLIDPVSYIVVSGVPAVMLYRLVVEDLGAPKAGLPAQAG